MHLDIIRSKLEEALQHNVCLQHPLSAVIETVSGQFIMGHNGPLPKEGKHERCLREAYAKIGIRHPPTSHGETSSIYKAARIGEATEGGSMNISDWFCCKGCAIAIVEAGIKEFRTPDEVYEDITRHALVEKLRNSERYEFERAEEILRLNYVKIIVEPRIRPFSIYSSPVL
jgi:deoxycytidylate deaminase